MLKKNLDIRHNCAPMLLCYWHYLSNLAKTVLFADRLFHIYFSIIKKQKQYIQSGVNFGINPLSANVVHTRHGAYVACSCCSASYK